MYQLKKEKKYIHEFLFEYLLTFILKTKHALNVQKIHIPQG